jgi:predicted nucleic acid-binding protein
MIVLDSCLLIYLFKPDSSSPLDKEGQPVERCQDRLQHLVEGFSKAGVPIGIPTPVMAEVLLAVGPNKSLVLNTLTQSSAFIILPFDTVAAVELAFQEASKSSKAMRIGHETKAKVRADRMILAIAKAAGATTVYSDDHAMLARALSVGLIGVGIEDLPLPPKPPQMEMRLPVRAESAGSTAGP